MAIILSSIGVELIKVVPIISTVLVILTFIISQIIAHYSRKNELRRSWYFKAYFDKSIDKVNDFFNECRLATKKSLKKVKTITVADDKQTYITKRLEDISDAQRDFKTQVLYPLIGAYPDVFRDITIILDSFYDVHSNVFDVQEDDADPFKIYLEEVANIKNNLMIFLAIPVLKNKQSKRLRKSLDKLNFEKEKFNPGKVFIIFLFLIIMILIGNFCYNHFSKIKIEHITQHDALINAKPFIESQLLSPSTANFSNDFSKDVKISSDTTAFINSYVDSQNMYGAIVRTTFRCKIIFSLKSGNYKCEKLTLSNTDTCPPAWSSDR